MIYLVTGVAGFIGFQVASQLCAAGHQVVGIDNLNDYYEVSLKEARLAQLASFTNFHFERLDLADREAMATLFASHHFERVIHLGAQAGVRYSIDNPFAYADSNLTGMLTVLEGCRHHGIQHLIYASSSSVYGMGEQMPYSTAQPVDHPVSLYAATKKSGELMAHAYSALYGLPTTGLRFFTVYGPWGRPDMAIIKFTRAILAGEPIEVYNYGDLSRDFTYIDDIVAGILAVANRPPRPNSDWHASEQSAAESAAPYRILNIGNGQPVRLLDFIEALEEAIGKPAIKRMLPMQAGDMHATWADSEPLHTLTGLRPATPLKQGVAEFVRWYLDYYHPAP
ncbi:NAD-dependent epimerase [Aeromonas allosaccharophila]|uniref:NAD-dependent epimerase n=1 Tax=Aeromonas allosaccharophila TaxID=656 RepID=UPI001BCDE865|nr:NAD-dependent epimerase [Aeromonas allosaccharophila]MBS4697115.1 NAD-dependent epimerase [Aeromonas allosaccharophila]